MSMRATIVDAESATEPGPRHRVLAQFVGGDAEDKAVAWIERFGQPDKVERGGYGLDVSKWCFRCGEYHSTEAGCS